MKEVQIIIKSIEINLTQRNEKTKLNLFWTETMRSFIVCNW